MVRLEGLSECLRRRLFELIIFKEEVKEGIESKKRR